MVIIWGSNYSIVKSAFTEVPPIAFNALRLIIASVVFAGVIVYRRAAPSTKSDVFRASSVPNLLLLALVGNTAYQFLFIIALSKTSAANSSLIIGCTPIFVALMTAALGHERIPAQRWAGVLLSGAGVYLVVGRGAGMSRESLQGDLLMLAAVFCWSAATIIARPLVARESPITVTALSMIVGTLGYLPFAWRDVRAIDWSAVSAGAWTAMIYSGLLALCVSYVIWYTAVQRFGNTRTAIYSNMVPVAGLLVAWLGYSEHIGFMKLFGASAIVAGVALTRV